MRIIVTGGAGFIGSCFLRLGVQNRPLDIANVHKLTYAGHLEPPLEDNEQFPLQPSSPYSAGKAGSDLLALSYHKTYKLPVIVTRASNNYGPCQFPEKLIPLMITHAFDNKPLPVYGDGMQ